MLGEEYKSVPLVKKVVKLLGALPYLQPETVSEGFEVIEISYVDSKETKRLNE